MILSNDGIKRALQQGALEISPTPSETQYTTSAVDLFLGDEFHVWDAEKLKVPGFKPELDLSLQQFSKTAKAFLVPLKKQDDGSVIFPPFQDHPWHMLAITRERVHLNRNFKLAARAEGRSSLARIGIIVRRECARRSTRVAGVRRPDRVAGMVGCSAGRRVRARELPGSPSLSVFR